MSTPNNAFAKYAVYDISFLGVWPLHKNFVNLHFPDVQESSVQQQVGVTLVALYRVCVYRMTVAHVVSLCGPPCIHLVKCGDHGRMDELSTWSLRNCREC